MTDAVESVCAEADRLVSGDRRSQYGHPAENFGDTAALLNVILRRKLAAPLDAIDVALIMVQLKLAREAHLHKRDNVVDAVGYLKCLDLVHQRIAEGVVESSLPISQERAWPARFVDPAVDDPRSHHRPPTPANPVPNCDCYVCTE